MHGAGARVELTGDVRAIQEGWFIRVPKGDKGAAQGAFVSETK
jgi:hypothetical protein